MLCQERNSEESVFQEMKSSAFMGRWEAQIYCRKTGPWGCVQKQQEGGREATGQVETIILFPFLKGTMLLLINVFKCLKDEKSYVLSYCDYKILLITVKLKQLWYFLKKQQLTGRFENPNDLYLNQCPPSLHESHTLCVGRRQPSPATIFVGQTWLPPQRLDLNSHSQKASLSYSSKPVIKIKTMRGGWGGRNFLCQEGSREQGILMQEGEWPL